MSFLSLQTKTITSFQKNILLMFRGSLTSQILGVFGTFILAKIYGNESFGIFSLFISISSIISIINTLQLENYIITSKNLKKSKTLMTSLLVFSFLITIFLVIVYLIFNNLIKNVSFELVLCSIIGAMLISFNKIQESLFTFQKKFKIISNAKILIVLFNITFQFLLYYKYQMMGLIYGGVLSLFLITLFYFKENKNNLLKISPNLIKNNISFNNSITKFIFPSSLINSFAINLVPILIVSFFSLKNAGIYFLSVKILAIPIFLISSSISQVYYQKSSEMVHSSKGNLFNFTKNIVLTNFAITTIFIIVINTIGIFILDFILDNTWENLSLYLIILSFLTLARSTFNPISNIIIILNKTHISLMFNIYLFIVNISGIYIGFLNNSLVFSLVFISLLGGIGYILILFYFLNELKKLKKIYE